MDDLEQKIIQWHNIPCVAGQIFTLLGVHFFDLTTVIIVAILVDLLFSILKYFFVSSFEIIYLTIGHSMVLWIWSIGTLIFFIIQGRWWIGAYALAYYAFLATIAGIPGILIDRVVSKKMGCNFKYFAANRFREQQLK